MLYTPPNGETEVRLELKRSGGRSLGVGESYPFVFHTSRTSRLRACPLGVPETLFRGIYEVKTIFKILSRCYLPFPLILS